MLFGGVVWALLSSLDTILLPKNSINLVVTDENGEVIEGLNVNVQSLNGVYDEDFAGILDIVILGAKPGKYIITFKEILIGYSCDVLTDIFELEQDGKVKIEYECRKDS